MKKVGIIADDMTGATTVGVLLARSGVRTAAYFDHSQISQIDHLDAVVLSSDSRALTKELAQKKVREVMASLKKMGIKYYSKRIDTTLRGGIGFEVDTMLEEMDEDTIAVMVPSMPQSNRILVGGYSVIDGVALSKTLVAQDVKTPIKESHVPTMYANQTERKIGQVGLASILAGKEFVKNALQAEREQGASVIIVDAIKLEDVDLIAESVIELGWNVLAIDPGPFTTSLSLLRGLNAQKAVDENLEKIQIEHQDGLVIAGIGSATKVTKRQISLLQKESYTATVSVNPELLLIEKTRDQEIQRAFLEMKAILVNPSIKIAIVETAMGHKVLNLEETDRKFGCKDGESSTRINEGLGEIIRQIMEDTHKLRKISGLYITGGDTMITILKTIGATGIHLIDYVIPQTDLGRLQGGQFEGLTVIGKGGLTGQEDTAKRSMERLFIESNLMMKGDN
ncbi:four-carbon acid sugar kinase family protein [Proteiniclasticum ruminis]|uniref:four-carbon acid sugar kinase family protein n=1 Tax=Proteiniclasticum ruminis TaxID=398199 RepID=UPI0028AB51DD|nr:four-carbon acid sugar kinase family protein [Proteiniclasticum ruminis]